MQVTIWWAGLMRGAVSMALAYNQVCVSDQNMHCSFFKYTVNQNLNMLKFKSSWNHQLN